MCILLALTSDFKNQLAEAVWGKLARCLIMKMEKDPIQRVRSLR